MIWFGILFLILMGFGIHFAICRKFDDCWGWLAVGALGAGFIIFVVALHTGFVIHYRVRLIETNRDLVVANEQYEKQLATITSLASQYPIEEKLLRDLNPMILLELPEIKSDTLLVKEIELALKYKDQVYKFQYRINTIKRRLDFHKHRWFSLTIANPNY